MGYAVTNVIREKLGKQLAAMFLVVVVFSLSLLQVNCTTISRREIKDPCPKLEVMTDSGCRPCSLCDPDQPKFDDLLIRESCKEKHGDVILPGKKKLWCDASKGPFPECPPISKAVIRSCTNACKNLRRRFAPGCKCRVGCPGNLVRVVECTRDLWWSDNTSIPAQCDPPSTTSITTRIAVIDTDLPIRSSHSHPNEEATPWYLVLLGVFLGGVIVFVGGLVLYWWYKKRRDLSMSSSESSSVDSGKSCQTDYPLLGPVKAEKDMRIVGERKAESRSAGQTASQHPRSQDGGTITTEVEVYRHVGDVTPESETLLGRGTGGCEEVKTPSLQALQALLRDYQALCRITKLLDQKDQFDKVTWHTVATEFVGWDGSTIRHMEYSKSFLDPDCTPGDSFTYQVLMDAYKIGKGLLELLHHLENRPHFRHPEAEEFLRDFWKIWKQKNAPGNGAVR